jgi:hypothetical protein
MLIIRNEELILIKADTIPKKKLTLGRTLGHRWIDARRYDRLDEIPTSYDNGAIFEQFPHPQSDLNWDSYTGN